MTISQGSATMSKVWWVI